MIIRWQTFTVNKRFALTISRGTNSQSTNVWVVIQQDNIEGWGEAIPFSTGSQPQTTPAILEALQTLVPALESFHPLDRQEIEQLLIQKQIPSAARAALDMALHDWLGKQVGLPLWQLWGLNLRQIVPLSVTIGISSPEKARQRVQNWLQAVDGLRVFKVKLGNPAGIESDRLMLNAVLNEIPENSWVYVDANGGWSLEDAMKMCNWLAAIGIKYVEQPLARGNEENLRVLYERSPVPIFVDESCFNCEDIPLLADRIHGINIKLMKSGGLTEALRMVHTAKACGLQVMFGCYSDSILANSAAAQIAPLADYLDLDSHLNLIDDPFAGAITKDGYLLPNTLPGLGVTQSSEF